VIAVTLSCHRSASDRVSDEENEQNHGATEQLECQRLWPSSPCVAANPEPVGQKPTVTRNVVLKINARTSKPCSTFVPDGPEGPMVAGRAKRYAACAGRHEQHHRAGWALSEIIDGSYWEAYSWHGRPLQCLCDLPSRRRTSDLAPVPRYGQC